MSLFTERYFSTWMLRSFLCYSNDWSCFALQTAKWDRTCYNITSCFLLTEDLWRILQYVESCVVRLLNPTISCSKYTKHSTDHRSDLVEGLHSTAQHIPLRGKDNHHCSSPRHVVVEFSSRLSGLIELNYSPLLKATEDKLSQWEFFSLQSREAYLLESSICSQWYQLADVVYDNYLNPYEYFLQ